jgi:hypothetical protein
MQVQFTPGDIVHKTMKSMDKASRLALLPNHQIYCADLSEGNFGLNTVTILVMIMKHLQANWMAPTS